MKLALNGATTMKADLGTDIRVASKAGFEGIELWASKLHRFLERHSTAELRTLLTQHALQPFSINSIERITFRDSTGHRALIDECRELCRIAAEIGCTCIVVVPSPLRSPSDMAESVDESTRVLRELADVAQVFGVRLAFEFLGQPDCSVQTLEMATEIVEKAAKDNLGLVIDTFHFYAGGSSLDAISRVDPKRLFLIHINDAEDRPRSELRDRHRLLPGLGILPLGQMRERLQEIGYTGVASVEIFRPEYWEMEPLELAQRCYNAAAGMFRQVDEGWGS
jgi:2-keto-myo-inositol isomerase